MYLYNIFLNIDRSFKTSYTRILSHLSIKNKLRIPFSGDGPTAAVSGRAHGYGHSGGGYGGGYGHGNDQLVLLRPPVQDEGGLDRLKTLAS